MNSLLRTAVVSALTSLVAGVFSNVSLAAASAAEPVAAAAPATAATPTPVKAKAKQKTTTAAPADDASLSFDEDAASPAAPATPDETAEAPATAAAPSAPPSAPTSTASKASRVVTLTQGGKVLAWPSELKWAKFKTPKGRVLRGPEFRVVVPANVATELGESSLDNGTVVANDNGALKLRLNSLKDVLHLPNASTSVAIAMKLEKSRIDTSACLKQNLKIEQVGALAKTPYYMFFSCQRRGGRIAVAFSHPLELETLSSTALEKEGKGEGYKVYELTSSANLGKDGELIRFEFRINGETQKFRINDNLRTGKSDEPKEPIFVYRAALGAGQFGITAPDRSQTGIQPLVSAEFRTALFFGRLAGSGGVFLSPGIALFGDSETYLGFDVGLGYRIGGAAKGQALYAEPSVRFYAIHQEFTKLGISAHHNQPGVGFVIGNKGSLDTSGFELSLGASGYGVTDQATHMDAGLRYAFLAGAVPMGLGLSYAQQSQIASRGTYSFQRMYLSLYFWP